MTLAKHAKQRKEERIEKINHRGHEGPEGRQLRIKYEELGMGERGALRRANDEWTTISRMGTDMESTLAESAEKRKGRERERLTHVLAYVIYGFNVYRT